MTAQQIIDEVRQIVQEIDVNNAHATDNQIITWINEAILQLCSVISTLPKKTITTTSADTVILPKELLRVDYASIYDTSNGKWVKLETNDFVNFARVNPDWQNADRNQPKFLIRMTDLEWMLYPKPSTQWDNVQMTIVGSYKPNDITSTSQEPELSITIHPAIVYYAAYKYFMLLNNTQKANMAFTMYDSIRKTNISTATSTKGSLLQLRIR